MIPVPPETAKSELKALVPQPGEETPLPNVAAPINLGAPEVAKWKIAFSDFPANPPTGFFLRTVIVRDGPATRNPLRQRISATQSACVNPALDDPLRIRWNRQTNLSVFVGEVRVREPGSTRVLQTQFPGTSRAQC